MPSKSLTVGNHIDRKAASRLLKLLAFLPLIGFATNSTASPDELAKAYRSAKDPIERRDVCLRAIDEGVLKQGVPLSVVTDLVGSDFDMKLEKSDGSGYGIVGFAYPSVSDLPNPPSRAAGLSGWFLVVEFVRPKQVVYYWLTNVHNATRVLAGPPQLNGAPWYPPSPGANKK
jgi:hypothetical protein